MPRRSILAVQLLGTVTILVFAPTNFGKVLAFLVLWLCTFYPFSKKEIILFFASSAMFSLFDVISVNSGLFYFQNPDLLGLPVYEFILWGFYFLHISRMVGAYAPSDSSIRKPVFLAMLFLCAFLFIRDEQILLLASSLTLIFALAYFHTTLDLAHAIYMVFVGILIEYAGIVSGEWGYVTDTLGGVPLWFIPMWGGIGLFFYRVVTPFLSDYPKSPRLETGA